MEIEKDAIWVFGKLEEEKVNPLSQKALSPARFLAENLNKKLYLFLFSEEREINREILQGLFCDKVVSVFNEKFKEAGSEAISLAFEKLVKDYSPFAVIFPLTQEALSVCGKLAGKLNLGVCVHVKDFKLKNEKIIMTRPGPCEDLLVELSLETSPLLIVLSQSHFIYKPSENAQKLPEIEILHLEVSENLPIKITKRKKIKTEENPLVKARLVLGAGCGIGDRESIEKLKRLAKLLGAEIGGTRPVCYAGLLPEERMIGISGVSISPEIYIAFGISGRIQHTAGIENAKFVVAVNTDENAPILQKADLALIGDAKKIIDCMLKKLENQ